MLNQRGEFKLPRTRIPAGGNQGKQTEVRAKVGIVERLHPQHAVAVAQADRSRVRFAPACTLHRHRSRGVSGDIRVSRSGKNVILIDPSERLVQAEWTDR